MKSVPLVGSQEMRSSKYKQICINILPLHKHKQKAQHLKA